MEITESLEQLKMQTQPFMELMTYYRCAIMEVETKFNVLNEEFSLTHSRNPIESIKTRLKTPTSIAEKLKRNSLPFDAKTIEDNLNDVAGVRVICSFPSDIYVLAHCLLKQDDIRLIKMKDYIKNPKPNGYRSLHLIIDVPIFLKEKTKRMRVEIQLRTIGMDFWASLEHKLKYKKDFPNQEEITKELKGCAEIMAMLDNRMQDIRMKIDESTE